MKDLQPVGDLLGSWLNLAQSKNPTLSAYIEVKNAWSTLCGEAIAQNSQVDSLENKILKVIVTHPTWLMELTHQKNKILDSLKEKFPHLSVTDIRFTIKNKKTK